MVYVLQGITQSTFLFKFSHVRVISRLQQVFAELRKVLALLVVPKATMLMLSLG